jgi:Ni/Co efflux regulator RcnB
MMRTVLAATALAAAIPLTAHAQSVYCPSLGYSVRDYDGDGRCTSFDIQTDRDNRARGQGYTDPYRDPYRGYGQSDYDPYSGYTRSWQRGQYLPADAREPRDELSYNDERRYGLPRPPDQNNSWYLVGRQFVLANNRNGLIAEVQAVPARSPYPY